MKFRPRTPNATTVDATPAEFDLEAEIKKAVRTDYSHANWGNGTGSSHSEAWDGRLDEHGTAFAEDGEASWHDAADERASASDASTMQSASAARSIVLPLALALTLSTILVALGVGAVALIRGGSTSSISDASPAVKVEDVTAPQQPAAVAEAKAGEPIEASLPAAAQPGAGIASSPASSQLTPAGGGAPASATPGPAKAQDVSPVPAASPNLPPLGTAQPSGQSPDLGTPHRVSTVSVKADGSVAPANRPKADAQAPSPSMAASSADAPSADASPPVENVAQPPKRPAEAALARPSAAAVANATRNKKTEPAASPAVVANNQQQPEAAPPATVASVLRKVIEGGNAQNAQPVAPPADAKTKVAGPAVSLKLASSTTEPDAQATLARLQKQFPGALTEAAVHREDMGKDGVFYRVRVGPLSREAANKICAQLKAGGASCSMSGG
ncbi:Sporulation related domain-containing protein [Rhizobiales bacterium GAS191]|nr:Sporulation related domain-containing protein [Rhizobiales bacterium GAS191]